MDSLETKLFVVKPVVRFKQDMFSFFHLTYQNIVGIYRASENSVSLFKMVASSEKTEMHLLKMYTKAERQNTRISKQRPDLQ